jgi:large subunit ribosomal protein L21
MYAILSHGGRQYRVSAGDRLVVDRLEAEVGSVVALEPVLLTGGDGTTGLGKDLDGVRVAVTVIAHPRGRKLRIFKYKAKKRSRKMAGYRSDLTELRVESILAKGAALPKAADTGARDAVERPATEEAAAPAARGGAPATTAKAKTKAAAAAKAETATSTAGAAADTGAAPARKSARRAAAPAAEAVASEETVAADSSPADSGTAKPKPAARTRKAAPKASRPSAAADDVDDVDDKENGHGA